MPTSLDEYRRKRDFSRTSEPRGERQEETPGRKFVVHKHAARRLHYDLRLEHDGVLLSWAVPKGISYDPGEKRLAMHVEDHPIEYGEFEGTIPAGEYGTGTVMLWDRGTWTPVEDWEQGLKQGKLLFDLHGARLKGRWTLVRMKGRQQDDSELWLLVKHHEAHARNSPRRNRL